MWSSFCSKAALGAVLTLLPVLPHSRAEPILISPIPTQYVAAGTAAEIRPRVETLHQGPILLTAKSSDPNRVRDEDIVIKSGLASSRERIVKFVVQPGADGSLEITLTAAIEEQKATRSFVVDIRPSDYRRSNNLPIAVSDNSFATPYPSVIDFGAGHGLLNNLRIELNGFAHRYPQDLDLLLQPPIGNPILLMSDAGGGIPVTNQVLSFSALLTNRMSADSLSSGTFAPSNYDDEPDLFPAPAPAPPYGSSLASLLGEVPDGLWKLYARDDTPSDGGSIARWTIEVQTRSIELKWDAMTALGPPLIVYGPRLMAVTLQSSQDLTTWTNTLSTNLDWNGAAWILETPSDSRRYFRVVK